MPLLRAPLQRLREATAHWPQRPGFATARELLRVTRGGDVDLSAMPADAAVLVRAAWEPVARDATCVVHGDPNPGNAIVDGERLGLIDWDEARVDVPAFDLAALGDAPEAFVTAGIAWEAAACWRAEPEYASRRLAELRDRMQRSR